MVSVCATSNRRSWDSFQTKMDSHLATALICLIAFTGPRLGKAQTCLSNWTAVEGKCLYFSEEKANYFEAETFCMNAGGRLFEAQNNVADVKVSEAGLVNFTNYWIGINDLDNEGKL